MKLLYLVLSFPLILNCSTPEAKKNAIPKTPAICWSYINEAVALRNKKKYAQALLQIEKHGECDPSTVRMSYHYHKGWTYYEMGRFNDAIDEFTQGLKTQPNYYWAVYRRGLCYEALGDMKSAQKDFKLAGDIGIKSQGPDFFNSINRVPGARKRLLKE